MVEQRGIPIFTDGSKLCVSTGAGIFCSELDLELHFKLKDDWSVFLAEIFAIFKAFEAIAGGPAADSESYMIFVDSTSHGPFASTRSSWIRPV